MKLKKLPFLFLISSTILFAQETEPELSQEDLIKEFGEKSCKCIDEIITFNKNKEEIRESIQYCIDKDVTAYQMTSKLMEATKTKGDSEISIGMDKESDEYKKYYYQIESFLMENCDTARDLIQSNVGEESKESENPQALEFYYEGTKLSKEGKLEEAIKFYKKAVKEDPNFAWAYDNMGICYRRLNKLDEAEKAYKKSIKIDPTGKMPLQNLAVVYIHKKKFKKAVKAYEKLKKVDSSNPEVYYGIGSVYYSGLNDNENALRNMCKAYKLYIAENSPYRSDAEKMINVIYGAMKINNNEAKFFEILKENNINME
ncbi:tetratricopeptide repeat protein [Aureivirga sp. CE67]|uniref:tetratricopeptide repeat protein n=1 Tax=Aureivirga sp. CE67 TaxID=1788983 RepID=UPI0018CA0CAE|nr:tetratricopeptide repeat protein [Aureivirga sp. CE67]